MTPTAIRAAALAALCAGASIGLAGPATAEPLAGTYNATYTYPNGNTDNRTWVLTPCGPTCSHLEDGAKPKDFQLQGNTWTYNASDGCSETIDATTLAGRWNCDPFSFNIQLNKTG